MSRKTSGVGAFAKDESREIMDGARIILDKAFPDTINLLMVIFYSSYKRLNTPESEHPDTGNMQSFIESDSLPPFKIISHAPVFQ